MWLGLKPGTFYLEVWGGDDMPIIWLLESSFTGDIFCVGNIVPGEVMFFSTLLLFKKLVLCKSTEIGVFWRSDW